MFIIHQDAKLALARKRRCSYFHSLIAFVVATKIWRPLINRWSYHVGTLAPADERILMATHTWAAAGCGKVLKCVVAAVVVIVVVHLLSIFRSSHPTKHQPLSLSRMHATYYCAQLNWKLYDVMLLCARCVLGLNILDSFWDNNDDYDGGDITYSGHQWERNVDDEDDDTNIVLFSAAIMPLLSACVSRATSLSLMDGTVKMPCNMLHYGYNSN